MPDKYQSFSALAAAEEYDIDYTILSNDRKSSIAIVAPHGREIEPVTSPISIEIAGSEYSLYLLEGVKSRREHGDLHIRSELFDEPIALSLINGSQIVIGVHGRKDNGDGLTTWVGGLNFAFRDRVFKSLVEAGFPGTIRRPGQTLAGTDPRNICNRGADYAGVQIEIPRTLRNRLNADRPMLVRFSGAVRSAISGYRAEKEH